MIYKVKEICNDLGKAFFWLLVLIMAFYSRDGYLIMIRSSGETPEEAIFTVLPYLAPIVLIFSFVLLLIAKSPFTNKLSITLYNTKYYISFSLKTVIFIILFIGFCFYADKTVIIKNISFAVFDVFVALGIAKIILTGIAEHKKTHT